MVSGGGALGGGGRCLNPEGGAFRNGSRALRTESPQGS